ncbi:LysR family transcriptional regulator [Orrella sp. JC864]|uniref:LysR family transcriptional regulator n=1 Tax=Orrella sp. JC864 TaxID=3120298 RepID=UPI0012BCCCC7
MSHSLDALSAFVETCAAGSFSAAARKLGKSQSTVSEAVANLEIDLGVTLFDRSHRHPVPSAAGQALLAQAREVLSASERLARAASRLSGGQEPRLTVAMSDTYQSERLESILAELDRRYPDMEFECLISEDADAVAAVQRGRAQLGLLAAREDYPADLEHARLPDLSEITLVACREHPLAALGRVTPADLRAARELRIAPYVRNDARAAERGPAPAGAGRYWSAPSYLMLLEMAAMGFGWTRLPRWLVARFAPGNLVELRAPGWPQRIPVDVVWSNQRKLGPAGAWLLESVQQA